MQGSLSVGFSWSLFFCQRINEGLLRQLPALSHSEVVTDRGPPVVFNAGRQDERHYVYGDNLGFMSGNRSLVEDGVAQLADHFAAFSARIQQDGKPEAPPCLEVDEGVAQAQSGSLTQGWPCRFGQRWPSRLCG